MNFFKRSRQNYNPRTPVRYFFMKLSERANLSQLMLFVQDISKRDVESTVYVPT